MKFFSMLRESSETPPRVVRLHAPLSSMASRTHLFTPTTNGQYRARRRRDELFVIPDKTSVNYEFWLEIDDLGDTRSAIASRSSIMAHVGEN
jgi:hypothetical protein